MAYTLTSFLARVEDIANDRASNEYQIEALASALRIVWDRLSDEQKSAALEELHGICDDDEHTDECQCDDCCDRREAEDAEGR
jgi:hypothetical protein